MKNKNPIFKFRYVKGLGDFIRCIIHCKLVTFFIKEPEYCSACQSRSHALNVLVKFPLWKLFFKNEEEMISSMTKEFEELGYVRINTQENKTVHDDSDVKNSNDPKNFDYSQITYDNFFFASKTEVDYDNTRVVTLVFKKKLDEYQNFDKLIFNEN